jgi:hypothetical protein
VSLTQETQPVAKAIFYARHPEGQWGYLTPAEKSEYYDQAQAAEETIRARRASRDGASRAPQQSVATQRVTLRLKLDWIKKAAQNSAKLKYNDPALEEATRILESAGPMFAELLDDDEVHGPSDYGREFVRRYVAMRNLNNRRRSR